MHLFDIRLHSDVPEMAKFILLLIHVFIQCHFGDATSYHIAFLGRTSAIGHIGMLQTSGVDPDITSTISSCTDNVIKEDTGDVTLIGFSNNDCANLVPSGTELGAKGISVFSSDTFTLHVFQTDDDGNPGDGYLAIPDSQLGTEYFVATYCTLGGVCQFIVTATQDATLVTVVFPDNIDNEITCVSGMQEPTNVQSGTALPYIIHEYDTLHFESTQDLSGTYIKSSQPVGVIVGARNVPTADDQVTNTMEQIMPVNKWGTEFVVAPNRLNLAGDIIKIVSKIDSTIVHILGFSPFMMQHAGDVVERRVDWQLHSRIHASNPVMIMQILSIDLYNGTNDVTGSPSIVLVPHTDQKIGNGVYFHCTDSPIKIFSVLVNQSDTITVTEPGDSNLYDDFTEDVPGTLFKVFTVKPSPTVLHVILSNTRLVGYGYCDGVSSFLLASDWTVENEECVLTTPAPGDDIDNDCNGKIDEVNCTVADLEINFLATQYNEGKISYKTIAVRGTSKVKFTVKTCDVAMMTFTKMDEPGTSLTISIGEQKISLLLCHPVCEHIAIQDIVDNPNDCQIHKEYELNWESDIDFHDKDSILHTFTETIEFDEMVISAFVGNARYVIFLPEKDCGKVYRERTADSHGSEFLIPVTDSDSSFQIVLTNSGPDIVSFAILQENNVASTVINGDQSVWISKGDITEASYSGINLYAYDGEISVYVLRQQTNGWTGFSVIPIDVLGPSFHLHHPELSSSLQGSCVIFALNEMTQLENLGVVGVGSSLPVLSSNSSLSYRRLLHANRPVAVFCGRQSSPMYAQMPPRETLGHKHFIPPIDFNTATIQSAKLYITATEDSTVVVVKGDYHNLDSTTLTGDSYSRAMESNTLYDIEGTKPIQVHMEIQGGDGAWNSLVVIPPTNQYTSDYTMFDLSGSAGLTNTVYQVGVDSDGNHFDSSATFSGEMFVISFLAHTGATLVVTNKRNYADINEVCKITSSDSGDEIDNDCDGLVDEEVCSSDFTPGEIDDDIDGTINGDCDPYSQGPAPTNIMLEGVNYDGTTCSSGGAISAPNTDNIPDPEGTGNVDTTSIVVSGTIADVNVSNSITIPELVTPDNPGLLVIMPSQSSISFGTTPSTTSGPNSTPEPEEICPGCMCPCGWVLVQNYTKKEIEEKVMELVQKLTVSKDQLSATIRKKISASDDRPQATTVGTVAIVWLGVMVGAIIILDISSVIRDVKMLISNVRSLFKK